MKLNEYFNVFCEFLVLKNYLGEGGENTPLTPNTYVTGYLYLDTGYLYFFFAM